MASTLSSSPDQTRRWFGALLRLTIASYHGRHNEALTWAERATKAYAVPGVRTAISHRLAASFHEDKGRIPQAIAEIEQAVTNAKEDLESINSLLAKARLTAKAGRATDADAAFAAIQARLNPLTATVVNRALGLARGQMAIVRKQYGEAITHLTAANALLPPRSANFTIPTLHLPIWFALGTAHYESGKVADALPWFDRVASSGYEHAFQPMEFVRSFYFLGKIHEAAGDMTKAREAYRRFVGYWKDGEIDRDRIAEAQRKLQ